MFSWIKKKLVPNIDVANLADWDRNCPDCGAERGNLHDLFCTKERCPFCGGQLFSCKCMFEVLKLDHEERGVVEEYVNDTIEPLRSIMERWKVALEKRGRVPFKPQVLSVSPESLIYTAARGALPFVRALLAKGIPVDATNEVNYTALLASARSYRLDVLKFLLDMGADVHHRDKYGHTALHCAVGSSTRGESAEIQAECVRLLLRHGAEINARDESQSTPLMSAAWFGCERSVECLLQAGAESSLRDSSGKTAAQLARERCHENLAKRLEQ